VNTILRFTVPGAPVPCARARVFKDSRTGKTRSANPARTTAYKRAARTHCALAANLARWKPDAGGEYEVVLVVYRAKRVGDLDNYYKGVIDAMKGIAWVDDRQVVEAHVTLRVDRVNPRVVVSVAKLESEG
jgi:Holliday junction resolvase RusA-like endonuclease